MNNKREIIEANQSQNEWESFVMLKNTIFGLNTENFIQSSNFIISKFCKEYSISYNISISRMIYNSLLIKSNNFDIYLRLLQEIEKFEENNKITSKIIDSFSQFLLRINTQESFYFLNYMINYNLLEAKVIQNKCEFPFFAHINQDKFDKYKYSFDQENIACEELSKNDFALHKKYIKEGHNPKEIAKIIRNDEIEKLQEISSQNNFNFNQTIPKSIYERCSFINNWNVTLIDYAAFFSSVKCFKYLLMNGAKTNNTGKYAVAGGNIEIVHLCEQNHSSVEDAYETAIKFHRNDIFKYIYENKLEKFKKLEELGVICVSYFNYEIFTYLENEGMKINVNIINEAAKIGNIFLVKYFLKNNQLPENILVFASSSGNIELVTYILNQKGFYINAKNNDGYTALIIASARGHIEIVKLLLKQEGIDINAKNKYGQSALIWASQKGYIEIVKLLLEQEGIDIDAKDRDGGTALILASREGHTEIVKLLLEQEGIDVNEKSKYGYTAFIKASENGHTEIVKLLLEQEGIDVNAKSEDGDTALMLASWNGRIEIVKLLLEQRGIDVNAKDNFEWTALIRASGNGQTEIVKLLLEQESIDINAKNKNGYTALIWASYNGQTEIFKLLLEQKGIDVNAEDEFGITALIWASYNGQTEIVKLLLEQKGIDVNAKNKNGITALIWASSEGHTEIVKLLLEQEGIDINAKDDNGRTALMIASSEGHTEIVKLLLEQEGIDINAKDRKVVYKNYSNN